MNNQNNKISKKEAINILKAFFESDVKSLYPDEMWGGSYGIAHLFRLNNDKAKGASFRLSEILETLNPNGKEKVSVAQSQIYSDVLHALAMAGDMLCYNNENLSEARKNAARLVNIGILDYFDFFKDVIDSKQYQQRYNELSKLMGRKCNPINEHTTLWDQIRLAKEAFGTGYIIIANNMSETGLKYLKAAEFIMESLITNVFYSCFTTTKNGVRFKSEPDAKSL